MKQIYNSIERFYIAFGKLKSITDRMPLSSQDRQEILEYMVDMKAAFDSSQIKEQ